MLKRLICVLLVVFMLTAVFTGCTGKTSEKDSGTETVITSEQTQEKDVKLTYWAYSRWKGIKGTEPDGEYGDWQRSIAKTFSEQNPHVKIDFEHLPWDGGPEKVSVSIASKTQPDVLEDGTIRFFGYASMGALMSLDDYYTQEELNDFFDGVWDLGKYSDGKHYLLPWVNNVLHMNINKTLFEKANAVHLLPQNEERTWTYDEFKEALKAVSKDGVYGTVLYAGNEQGDSGPVALMWGFGSRIFSEDLSKIIFNTPEAIKGVEFAKSLIDEGLAMPGAETMLARETSEYFKQQKIAIHPNGSSGQRATVQNAMQKGEIEPFEITWAMHPTAPGVDPAFYANPIGLCVFKSDDGNREKWAIEFGKFAINTENSKVVSIIGGNPVRKSVGDLYPGDELFAWAKKVVKYSRDPGLGSPAYPEMRAALFPEMQAVYNGSKDPKTAMDDYVKKAQAAVDKYKK